MSRSRSRLRRHEATVFGSLALGAQFVSTVRQVTTSAGCYTCAREAEAGKLPPWESIVADDLWRVAHSFDSALEGWLVLLPRRHVTSVGELSDAEAQSLGTWLARLSQALHRVLGCQKTYVAQFAEREGFSHVHFHVVARPPGLAQDLRGHRIFQLLGSHDRAPVSEQRRNKIARQLSLCLGGETTGPGRQPPYPAGHG